MAMTWWQYVERVSSGAAQGDIAQAAGVSGPTVSRWRSGKQGVDPGPAARFARAYGRPVLEAFVAAGFLTPEEAKAKVLINDPQDLTDEELLELLRSRLHGQRSRDGHQSAPMTERHAAEVTAPAGPGVDVADELAHRRRSLKADQIAADEVPSAARRDTSDATEGEDS
ncbi:helix-turn-helix transcriptional regulator [Actinotalea sp. Marseille-Q4924]|uniref:helix-turn-helix domain-containing protein n=1 Tax=Actinotalea sp. Marseille-Q4924 TaxID=2866571 RepID=UPI001CE40753|nr:helix-turn-helix transcriptional regulator [Actinotalea sp. Marseille-Q4924]